EECRQQQGSVKNREDPPPISMRRAAQFSLRLKGLSRACRMFSDLLPGVNLGALEFVGVVDVDGFPGGVEVEGSGAAFAVAVAGLLDSAEGEVNFGSDSWGVDVGDAGFEVADGAESLVHVAGVESRGKAVLDAVGGFHGFVEVCNFDEADDGAEDLFAGDAHFRFYGAEDGGGEEVAFVEGSVFERVAAGEQLGSFFF